METEISLASMFLASVFIWKQVFSGLIGKLGKHYIMICELVVFVFICMPYIYVFIYIIGCNQWKVIQQSVYIIWNKNKVSKHYLLTTAKNKRG